MVLMSLVSSLPHHQSGPALGEDDVEVGSGVTSAWSNSDCVIPAARRMLRNRDNEKGPEPHWFRAFQLVAGAGFEPATFGL